MKDKILKVDKWIGKRKLRVKKSFNKLFCIGLHKTGTTSMYHMFAKAGLKPHHGTNWCIKKIPNNYTEKNTSFTDGGGHFWFEDYEFGSNHEVRLLDRAYPNSKFILNVRPIKSWSISKMLHASWDKNTEEKKFEKPKSPREAGGDGWKDKSVYTIKG
jgi:hypothetical protein